MQTQTRPQSQTDVWEKWNLAWDLIFYLSILASVFLDFRSTARTTPILVSGLLAFALVLWHWAGMRFAYRQPFSWEDRSLTRFIILSVGSLIWFTLVLISPAFYVILFGLFLQVFRHLPIRFAIISALILSGAVIAEQAADSGGVVALDDPAIWLFLFISVVSVLLALWISAIIQQSTQRRELVEELERTQVELIGAERRAGILQERQRLSQEIHDTLAQGFTSIVMLLESADQVLPANIAPEVSADLNLARQTARQSLEEARRLVWELRPEQLENANLSEALQGVCIAFGQRSALEAEFVITGEMSSPHPEIEICLLRALQEALHNVEKHADATQVTVTLSYVSGAAILDVSDDGIGFDPQQVKEGHFGLITMRERVEKLHGTLLIESDADEGTTLVIEIPLEEQK